jgi:hypothetical protein
MAQSFIWTFPQFETAPSMNGLSNVVVAVHWRLTAMEDDIMVSDHGITDIPIPDPGTFIEHDMVSIDQVINWVSSVLDVDAIKANLDRQIAEQKNRTVIQTVPAFNQ